MQALPCDLSKISENDGLMLTRAITKLEIHQALLSLLYGKSPGPDRFNVEFFCYLWDDIGDHLCAVVQFFFDNAVMPASSNRTYVSLIPKRPNPSQVVDYRPISLCNVCYKIVSKILANFLKPFLPNLISFE